MPETDPDRATARLGAAAEALAVAAEAHTVARLSRVAAAVAAHDAGLSYAAVAQALGIPRQSATALIEHGRRIAADDGLALPPNIPKVQLGVGLALTQTLGAAEAAQ